MRRLRPVLLMTLAALCLLGILAGTLLFRSDGYTAPLDTLGMMLQEEDGKLTVIAVMEGSPAFSGGVLPGDVLLTLGDVPVSDLAGFEEALASLSGAAVHVSLLRGGETRFLTLHD